jgi:tetratricopeptide (TPR) repeat protein
MARNDLAETYANEGLLGDAVVMQERTLEMQRDSNDFDLRLATLSSLALLYDAQSQLSSAEAILKEEVELQTERSGQHSRETLLVSCHLARVYKGLGKYRDAAKLLEEVITFQGKLCYVDHFDTEISKRLYASLPRECRE